MQHRSNWIEARYFLARLPARWGKLRGFFLLGFSGVLALTASFAALPWLAQAGEWDETAWLTAAAAWNSLLILVLPVLLPARFPYLVVAETFAPVAECTLFWAAFGTRAEWGRRSMGRDFLAITLANLASFGLGELLNAWGWFAVPD